MAELWGIIWYHAKCPHLCVWPRPYGSYGTPNAGRVFESDRCCHCAPEDLIKDVCLGKNSR